MLQLHGATCLVVLRNVFAYNSVSRHEINSHSVLAFGQGFT